MVYLDARTDTYLEELSAANIFAVTARSRRYAMSPMAAAVVLAAIVASGLPHSFLSQAQSFLLINMAASCK